MKAHGGDRIARYCKVLLDGVDVTKDCGFADEEAGLVTHYRRGDDGRYFIDRNASSPTVATLKRRGVVRILVPWWRRVAVWITPSWHMVRFGRRLVFLPWWKR